MKRPRLPRRKPKTKRDVSPLPSIVSLIARPWRVLWGHKLVILAIVAVIEIPSYFFLPKPTNGSTSNLDAYGNFAAIFMNVALLYAAAIWNGGASVRFKQAYYCSSAFIVRYLLASIVVVLGLIPALIGVILFVASTSLTAFVGPATGATAVVALIAIVLSLPSIWFITRFLLAPVAVVASDLTPIDALRRSRNLSLGRFWRVLSRLIMLLAVTFLIGGALGLPSYLITLAAPAAGSFMSATFELAFVFIWLPYATVYLVTLYRDMETAEAV